MNPQELAYEELGDFKNVLDFPLNVQKLAMSRFDEIAEAKARIFKDTNIHNRPDKDNEWKDFLTQQANSFATSFDPEYEPGTQGGNSSEITLICRNKFYNMFTFKNPSSEQILKAKRTLEDMIV